MLPLTTTEILKKLDKKELKRFGDFIESPYFNSIEKLGRLYDEVIKYYPDFESDRLEFEKMYKKLYPGKPYKQQEIKNLYSEFGSILRRFITQEEINLDKSVTDLHLVKGLTGKKLFEISNKFILEIKRKKTETEKNDYYSNYLMETAYHNNLVLINSPDSQEIFDISKSASEYFIVHFMTQFLSMSYEIAFTSAWKQLENKNHIPEEFINHFNFEKFFEYLDTRNLKYTASLKIKYLLYLYTIKDVTEEDYFALKKILVDNIDNITPHNIMGFWGAILDIISIKLLPKNPAFRREVFELNDFLLKLKLYPNNSLHPFTLHIFKNVITIAILLKEYEWGERFLKEYVNYLHEDHREYAMNYHMGKLSFRYGRYKESLDYLNKVTYADIYDKLNIRFYYLMNYIELNLYDAAISLIKSMREFTKKSKEMHAITLSNTSVKDSLKFFNEIIKTKETGNKLDYSIYKEAQNTKSYYYKQYIVETMEKMI